MCHGVSAARERECEGDTKEGGQQGHLLEGHLASLSSVATIVPVCVIKTVCRAQTWRWKSLRRSASSEKQDYLGISTGFEIPAKVLHPFCVLHHVSVHCGITSKPAMSKPLFALSMWPAGSVGHWPLKPLARILGQREQKLAQLTASTCLRGHHGHKRLRVASWELATGATGSRTEQALEEQWSRQTG